jgi:hypothetical protein
MVVVGEISFSNGHFYLAVFMGPYLDALPLKLLDQGEPQSAVARLLNCDQSTIGRLAARSAT